MANLEKKLLIQIGKGEWWAIASALGFALSNLMTRVVSVGGDPLAGTIIRSLPLILVSLVLMAWRHNEYTNLMPKREEFLGWRALGLLAFSGLVVVPVSILSLYLAFRYGGVLVAVPIFAVNPLWGALIAVPFLGEAFNKRIGGGIIVTVVGIALLTYGQHVGTPVSSKWMLGVIYASITALTWALIANFRRYLLSNGINLFWMIGITSTIGTIVLLAFLAGQGRLDTLSEFSSTQIWQLLSAGGLNAIGNFTLSAAFTSTTVASVTTLKSLDVVIASVVAIFFMGEVLNLSVGLGIILLVGGIIVVQTGKALPLLVRETT